VNTVTTCGAADGTTMSISSNFGKRTGSVSTTDLSDAALEKAVRTSEELARLAPDNEEFMPPLEAGQSYLPVKAWDEETADCSPELCAELVAGCLKRSQGKDLDLAGFFSIGKG